MKGYPLIIFLLASSSETRKLNIPVIGIHEVVQVEDIIDVPDNLQAGIIV
jgi:hypothetical protein